MKIEGGPSEIAGNFRGRSADLPTSSNPVNWMRLQDRGPTAGGWSYLGKEAVRGWRPIHSAFHSRYFHPDAGILQYRWLGCQYRPYPQPAFHHRCLTAMGFTLTAAGIAGLVLTIGMAVDTNVIIFERIRKNWKRQITSRL